MPIRPILKLLLPALLLAATTGCSTDRREANGDTWGLAADGRAEPICPDGGRLHDASGDTATDAPDLAPSCPQAEHGTPAQVASTPRARPNLERLALAVSGEFVAPPDVYRRIVRDVSAIRDRYPLLDEIRYKSRQPPAIPNPKTLQLRVHDAVHRKIEHGTYDAWSCLNDYYGKESHRVADHQMVLLTTKGLYDTRLVARDYASLPGVESAKPRVRLHVPEEDAAGLCADRHGDTYYYLADYTDPSPCPADTEDCDGPDLHFRSNADGCIERISKSTLEERFPSGICSVD